MTCYVISRQYGGTVAHQGTRASCEEYVRNVSALGFVARTDMVIAEGAESRKATLALIRRQTAR